MVGLDLHAEGKCKQSRPEHSLRNPSFPTSLHVIPIVPLHVIASHKVAWQSQGHTISEYDPRQHPREICDSLHLGVMPHLNYLHVVRTEGNGDCSGYGDHLARSHGQHQQETTDESQQQVACRAASGKEEIINIIGPVTIELIDGCRRRHASEHGVGPCGRIFRMLRIIGHGLIRHSLP